MLHRLLADLVVVLHLAFVLFVVLGGLLVLRRPWLAVLHVPAAVWGALVEFADLFCPLTTLENSLRQRAGEAGYPGGFIEHYVIAVLYPAGLTRGVQLLLGAVVVAVNVWVYARLLRRARRSSSPPEALARG